MTKRAKRIIWVLLGASAVLITLAFVFFFGNSGSYSVTTYSMGSYVQQTVYGSRREDGARNAADAVAKLEDLISWRIESSDISRLNSSAGSDFISIDPWTKDILSVSSSVCEASGGAFDFTISPLSRLWDFDENPHLPDPALIEKCLPLVDYTTLSLLGDGTAALQKTGFSLDLGAVGKGAACDYAVYAYEQTGVDRAVVAVGGSVGLFGKKPFGEPWKIAVRDPKKEGSLGELSLTGGFISTSGSYEKCFTENGQTYFHLLDPKTGYPAESGLVSVTVWAASGTLSDALSTACFVLGMEKSLPLLEQFDAGGIFITDSGEIYVTENLSGSFRLSSTDYTLKGTL